MVLLVLTVSGAFGFLVWMAGFSDWQVAVETAQVIAGIVRYPPGNPFHIYHLKLWTVVHELCAVSLAWGVSEIALSKIVSGVVGMVAFQALSVFVYALSRDAWLAIGSVFVIVMSRAAEYGVTYPIYLTGTSHTYGALGLSMLVLVAALLGTGRSRLGGFLLGAMPAVHPSLGLWLGLIVGICLLWDSSTWREHVHAGVKPFLAGCGLTLVSLGLHLAVARDMPVLPAGVPDKYFSAFIAFWDGHRQPVDLGRKGVSLNIAALILSLVWLKQRAQDLPRSSAFVLRFVAVTTALSLSLALVSWVPPAHLPAWFLILMPSRLLNVGAMTLVALVFGLLGAYREHLWSRVLTLVLCGGLLIADRSLLWDLLRQTGQDGPQSPIPLLAIPAIAVVGLFAGTRRSRASGSNKLRAELGAGPVRPTAMKVARLASLTLMAAAGVLVLALSWNRSAAVRDDLFLDRTNDPMFAAVASGTGILLTGGDLHLVQLRTRRPVLLDGGGLDGLAYALEAGPAMAQILREVYSIDWFDPPREAWGSGSIPPAANRKAWEQYDLARWQSIRRAYGVTQVLTYADWQMSLPAVAHNRTLALYAIPD